MHYPHKYDEKTKTVSILFDFDAETLVPSEVVKKWSTQLREHKTPCGRELEGVHFIFADEKCAEYNRQALDFANIETYVGSLEEKRPLGGEKTEFSVREDFGIESDN